MDQSVVASIAQNAEASKVAGCSRRLIVMTRIPEAGRVKTRLIPALGSEGAAALHAALLNRTLRIVEGHARQVGVEVEIRFTGGTPDSIEQWRNKDSAVWREQQGQDLGERMHIAISAAISEGATAVIVIGTDCPDLSAEVLDHAWRCLETIDLVLGPAEDGGYYLIGMKQPDNRLFQEINWGTERVLRQTQQQIRERNKSFGLLPVLSDVDEAEDLILCRHDEDEFADCLPRSCAGLLSVVIPTWNEVSQLEETLQPILKQADVEVIIADGGSSDGTLELARRLGCRVISANRGRGRQMNAGAALARGEFLLFLHADTRVPEGFCDEIQNTLNDGAIAGAFRFQFDQPGWGIRCVEWGTNLRARYLQLPYGDQGIFLRSSDFFRIGGFKNWPLMEDFELCRRLRRHGRIRIAATSIRTSARRWMKLGVCRTTIINHLCIAGFRLGISPERLASWYSSSSSGSAGRLWDSVRIRSLLAVCLLMLTIGFAYRTPNKAGVLPDLAHQREVLTQMMEQNRLAFPEADEVNVSQITEILSREKCVLIDVRTDVERSVSIIPGAISAAEYERTSQEHSGQTVICYCTIGYRSADYAQKMKRRGFTIASFNGSIVAWCQAGQKLTTPDGRETKSVHVYGPKWDLVPPEYQSVR